MDRIDGRRMIGNSVFQIVCNIFTFQKYLKNDLMRCWLKLLFFLSLYSRKKRLFVKLLFSEVLKVFYLISVRLTFEENVLPLCSRHIIISLNFFFLCFNSALMFAICYIYLPKKRMVSIFITVVLHIVELAFVLAFIKLK